MNCKIRPCPFCGTTPELRPKNPMREGNAWGAVVCVNKACPTFNSVMNEGVSVRDGIDVSDDRGPASYIAAAVNRWNVRK